MSNSEVEIFLIDMNEKNNLIKVPKSIKYEDFIKLIIKPNYPDLKYFHIVYNDINYDENKNDVLELEEGDKIYLYDDCEEEGGFIAEFHPNLNLNENEIKVGNLTGILQLILIKHISANITNINAIKSIKIKEIIEELKIGLKMENNPEKDIQANLKENSGNNIIEYSNYVCSLIKDEKDIYELLNYVDPNKKNEIMKYWTILTIYEEFNKRFHKDLLKAIEESYFDYSLIALSIYEQANRKEYIEAMNSCPNKVVKYLFHGTQIDPVSKIITGGFKYTRKAFYGMGIYFSDMLDYVGFYAGGNNYDNRRKNFGKILPVNTNFSCVSAEIYYNKGAKRDIFDFDLYVDTLDHFPTYEEIKNNYKDKMVQKYGIHFAKVEATKGQVRKKDEIIEYKKKGKFLGNEYVITEFCQILPLYGLTFKRNEYFVLWRDPNFKGKNYYSDFLKDRKLFINKYAKMNAYFESNTEKALEIIKRKKYNKIILISSIGLDLSGKKFVEVARKILGFDVIVLFFSANRKHFSWLQNFPNCLYTSHADFYKDYILNYNKDGLQKLKEKIEKFYKIKLKFNSDILKFPNFVNDKKYDDIFFDEPSPHFKKVIIKNMKNNYVLCMENNRKVTLKSSVHLDVNLYFWKVTILDGEMTLYSNDGYLGADLNQYKVTGEEFMQRYKYEQKNKGEFILYYQDKNNVLTSNGNELILQKENYDSSQLFKMVEDYE